MKIPLNKKIIISLILILFLSLFSNRIVFAVWDGLPYDPGETDNPECLPSQTDCDVSPAIITETDPVFIASQAFSITGADITKLSNLSGTNTGDNAVNSLYSGLATSKQDTLVSGTNIKTINSTSILGSGDISISTLGAEVPLTFSSGLTRATNTITNNLITGLAGGQTIIGGTASSENLTLSSTSNATKGKILFGTSAYDEVNNRLGIGTTTPITNLDVAGSGRFTGAASSALTGTADPTASTTLVGTGTLFTTELVVGDRITVNTDTRVVTAIASDTSLTVNSAFTDTAPASITKLPAIFIARDSSNAIKMVITDQGNVGIGVTNPTQSLEVTGRIYASTELRTPTWNVNDNVNMNAGWAFNWPSSPKTFTLAGWGANGTVADINGGDILIKSGQSTGTGTSIIHFYTATAGSTGTTVNTATEKMTILGSGNVGIGTTSPGTKLEVKSDSGLPNYINVDTTSSGYNSGVVFKEAGTVKWSIGNKGSDDSLLISYNSTPFAGSQFAILNTGNVGIGTTTPTRLLTLGLGHIDFRTLAAPSTAPTVALAGTGAGNVDNGTHYYYIKYVTSQGTTGYDNASEASVTVVDNTTDGRVSLTNIPVSSDTRVTGRKIYRTSIAGGRYIGYLLATINDNTTTTYTDNTADSGLTTTDRWYRSPNTTAGRIYKDGGIVFFADDFNTFLGVGAAPNSNGGDIVAIGNQAGASLTSGTSNVLLGPATGNGIVTGYSNTFVGASAGRGNTTPGNFSKNAGLGAGALQNNIASDNSAFGYYSMLKNTTGANNVAMGSNSLFENTTGGSNVALGYDAGRFITGLAANTTSDFSVYVGVQSKAFADNDQNEIVIGYSATGIGSNSVVLGNDNILTTALKGKVGIGTTAPGYALHVGSTSVTDATVLLRLQDADSTCDFTANAGAPTCGSDETLKKNINDQSDNLSKIIALRPVTYNWLTDSDDADAKHGFIAQEVANVMPELVTDGTWIDGTTRKFLQTAGMAPYIVGAIKEMNLKLLDLNNFEKENDWRDSLMAWMANAENRITRIFTGEICLTEAGEESVCINRTELQSLKALLNNSSTNTATTSTTTTTTDDSGGPTPVATCSDGIQNQDETDIDIGGVCTPAVDSDGESEQDDTSDKTAIEKEEAEKLEADKIAQEKAEVEAKAKAEAELGAQKEGGETGDTGQVLNENETQL